MVNYDSRVVMYSSFSQYASRVVLQVQSRLDSDRLPTRLTQVHLCLGLILHFCFSLILDAKSVFRIKTILNVASKQKFFPIIHCLEPNDISTKACLGRKEMIKQIHLINSFLPLYKLDKLSTVDKQISSSLITLADLGIGPRGVFQYKQNIP